MAKLFCVSDIHGFYDEFRLALDNSGFDAENEEHWLIVLGDNFGRGPDPIGVMRYLNGLPRKVLIKGNHELLLQDVCERGYPHSNDYSNGTFDTVCEFGGAGLGRGFEECCIITEQRIKSFIYSMVPYFETKNYVFTHGFIPVNCDDGMPMYYRRNRKFSKKENWREAHASEWEQAMWLNGMEMVHNGFGIDKCIVVGHWHASWGRMVFENGPEFGEFADFSPYYYDNELIAIDGCTAYSGKVNVLVLEDEFLEE